LDNVKTCSDTKDTELTDIRLRAQFSEKIYFESCGALFTSRLGTKSFDPEPSTREVECQRHPSAWTENIR
jgi:hypothetical protein